jgi:hypothetical protein
MKRDKWKMTNKLQRMQFEKLKKFVFDHPRNDSGWYELMYGYFFKGYYTDDLEDFLLSDDIDIIRGALTAMLETNYHFSPLNILIEKLNTITAPDIICKILLNIEQNIDEHNGLETAALILKQFDNDSIFVKKMVCKIINRLPSSILESMKIFEST